MLSIKEIFDSISAKYLELVNMFLKKLAIKLLRYLIINKYAINLENDK